MKKAAIISGVFISGLIGAGFATGSEIYFYFSRFGIYGLVGIFLAVGIFAFIQYAVLEQAHHLNSFTLDEYLENVLKQPLGRIVGAFAYIFMIFILSAMLSGFGEMMYEVYGINKLFGVLFMLFFTVIIVQKGYRGFVVAQSLLSVAIILIIGGVCLYILFFRETQVSVFKPELSWAGSALSYAGYNMLTAVAVLCILARDSNKRANFFSAVITFFVLSVLMCIMWYIICLYDGMINLGSMPVLRICMRISGTLAAVYAVSVFISMLTTAVSSAYALRVRWGTKYAGYLIYAVSFFMSGFDFSFIVDKLYRAGGVLSLILIAAICRRQIKKHNFFNILSKSKKNKEKKRYFTLNKNNR